MHKLKLLIGITLASILPLTLEVDNQVALAEAHGCSISPGVITCIDVYGDGLKVPTVRGRFGANSESPLCHWQYVIAFIPDDGSKTSIAPGPVHNSCDSEGTYVKDYIAEYRRPYIAKRGKVCARLYHYGTYIDAACEDITP